jgi:PAS domain S-box-containing protein
MTKGLPIPVLLTRASDGTILYANALSCRSFGVPHEALIGRSILEFYLHPAERQVMLTALRRSGRLYDYTLQLQRADGSCFKGLTSLHSLQLNGEEALIEWIYDVSARQRLETPSAPLRHLP